MFELLVHHLISKTKPPPKKKPEKERLQGPKVNGVEEFGRLMDSVHHSYWFRCKIAPERPFSTSQQHTLLVTCDRHWWRNGGSFLVRCL